MKPELLHKLDTKTSNGVLSKGWYKINDKNYLVKGNSNGVAKSIGHEPFSEVLAYRFGALLGIPIVPYSLARADEFADIRTFGCEYVSVCKEIPRKRQEQMLHFAEYADITAGKIVVDYSSFYKKSGLSINYLYRMLLFDAVIGNFDRHLNNFDVIYNGETGEVKNAPIFDNGASLLAYVPDNELRVYNSIGPDKAKPFKDTHVKQMRLLNNHFGQYDFEVDIHTAYKEWLANCEDVFVLMDPLRVKAIKSYVQSRIHTFCDSARVGGKVNAVNAF